MKEVLYEESAFSVHSGREEKINKIFKIVAIVFFVASLVFILTTLPTAFAYFFSEEQQEETLFSVISGFVLGAASLTVGAILWLLKNKFNVVYDYSFVSGDIRVSKVIGVKRKFLYEMKSQEIMKVGKTTDYEYSRYLSQGLKPKKYTPNKTPVSGKEFYYFYLSDSMGKNLLVLECREELIQYLSMFVGKEVISK